jgi:hypothetical protein
VQFFVRRREISRHFCAAKDWKSRSFKKTSQISKKRVDRLKVCAYNADIERGGAVASGG